MAALLDDCTPADLGLPSKFADFRAAQRDLTDFCLLGPTGDADDMRRFVAVGAPAGCGKSLLAHTVGKLSGVKYVVLTATRALEDQQVRDAFPCVHVNGRANYDCEALIPTDRNITCEIGTEEENCEFADSVQCPYSRRVMEAKQARGVLTNYQYWMHARAHSRTALERQISRLDPDDDGDPVRLLICDEAHKAEGELARFLSAWASNEDLHRFADKAVRAAVRSGKGADWARLESTWWEALRDTLVGMNARINEIVAGYDSETAARRASKEYRHLTDAMRGLARVAEHMTDGNWIWRTTRSGIAFDCVWPARYAERYLWSGVARIVLMSATLRPKALALTGVKQTESWFREWPRVFKPQDGPVYWVPTGRMGKQSDEEEKLRSIATLDRMCDEWAPHYKGMVHTHAYWRAEWVQANSQWGRHMLLNKPGEQEAVAERFRLAQPPKILVSPSYGTGFHFDSDDVKWQVINKLPFADRSDPVVQARIESDRDWYDYDCMQTFVQTCGRVPHDEGWGVTVVTDDAVGKFRYYSKQHGPRWFNVKQINEIPKCRK